MQLHELKIIYKRKRVKRVGRGGKRGSYSGKGIKGQKSRSGRKIRPAERDLIQRIPKLRGFKFKPLGRRPIAINVSDLEKKMEGNIISFETLRKSGLLRGNEKNVKILSNGSVTKIFEVKKGIEVSESAKKKIEEAGGKVGA